jgi:hypothetical protein
VNSRNSYLHEDHSKLLWFPVSRATPIQTKFPSSYNEIKVIDGNGDNYVLEPVKDGQRRDVSSRMKTQKMDIVHDKNAAFGSEISERRL